MQLRNDAERYGLIAILLHWTMAVLIFGQFFLGRYMVGLEYTHPWYEKAPDLHRSLGVLIAALLAVRWIWREINPLPAIEGRPWERRAALWVHRSFYVLMAATVISGYLISTADGQGVSVFGWFEIPAVFYGGEQQEDIAGEFHKVAAYALFFLALLHALAALKHHFIDGDATLRRMLGGSPLSTNPKE